MTADSCQDNTPARDRMCALSDVLKVRAVAMLARALLVRASAHLRVSSVCHRAADQRVHKRPHVVPEDVRVTLC